LWSPYFSEFAGVHQQGNCHKNFDTRPETQNTKAKEPATTTTKMVDDDSNSGSSNHSSKVGVSFDDSSQNSAQTNSNGSSTTNGTGTATSATAAGVPEAILATKETRAVHYSRMMVLIVLVISSAVAGGLSFWLFSESEKEDFKVQVSTFISCCVI
jgi:cobalamin biosynthesis Mg chelatase CobN